MFSHSKNLGPWEDWIYKVIAGYKIVECGFFIALAFGFLHLLHRNVADLLQEVFENFHFDVEGRFFHWLVQQAHALTDFKIRAITAFLFFHAALHGTEGIGLYLRKRWAEYLIIVSTASLLPIEIYELCLRVAWWKIVVFGGNVLILTYFIHRLRWEGEERGKKKDEAEARQPAVSRTP